MEKFKEVIIRKLLNGYANAQAAYHSINSNFKRSDRRKLIPNSPSQCQRSSIISIHFDQTLAQFKRSNEIAHN